MTFAHSVSKRNRERKFRLFLQLLAPGPNTSVLDVGFTDAEHSPNDNYLEKKYPWPARITALGIDAAKHFRRSYPKVTVVRYDGGIMPFANLAFDVGWSNAVIEHVGSRQRQVLFARELLRVSKVGFVTTPNRYFPIEVHTKLPLVHWLPKPVCDGLLRMCGRRWATGEYMNLLSRRDFARIFREAGASRLDLVANRFAGFTLDYVAIARL